ncbi:Sec63, partial [Serendipita sp. 405]
VERAHEKVYILLQAILGNISLGATEYQNRDSILPLEATRVYKHAIRLMSCVIEAAVSRGAGSLLKTSLELYRSLKAKGWEDRPTVLRQLEGIGEKAMQIFGMHGITSLDKFANLKPHQIDTWLNRKAPFGKKTLSMVNSLPRFTLSVEEVDTKPSKDGKTPVIVSLQIGCSATCEEETESKTKTPFGTASVLTCLSTGELVDYRRITVRALLREEKFFTVVVNLSKPSEVIEVHISPNDIAGLARTLSYKPFLSPDQYPVPDTRPVLKEEKEEIIDISSHNNSDNNLYRMRSGAGNHSAKTRPTNGVQTLSNGNYACNHRCKDKKDCHHRWSELIPRSY